MKRFILYTICALTTLLSGCFKDYEQRYLFEDNRLEFEDAVTNGNASGKTFPILGPFPAEQGRMKLRVNMTGAHADHDRIIPFRIVPEESTAVEERDFALPHGREFVIPANSSFGYIEVEFLPEGSGSPTIVLELLPEEDLKVLDRYHKIGVRFLYQLTRPDPARIQEMNGIKVYTDFMIGGQANQNIGNFVDFSTFNVYVRAGAQANSEHIDIGVLKGTTSGMNFLLPGGTSWGSWSGWNIPAEFEHLNAGQLMKITNPDQQEVDIFNNANSISGLLSAHSYFASTIATRAGYNGTNDGPTTNTRIRQIAAGDIIIHYSEERKLVAILRVKEVVDANAGYIVADIKSGIFDPADILTSSVLTIETLAATEPRGLINLADVTTYGFDAATTTAARTSTDFGYIWSTATGSNFGNFIAMSASFTGWSAIESSAGTGVLNLWDVADRNPGTFIHFNNPTPQQVQAVSSIINRDQLVAAYDQANLDVLNVPGYDAGTHGPSTRVRRMEAGSIIFFKSGRAGRDLYAVMMVQSLSTASSTNRRMELLIKSDLN